MTSELTTLNDVLTLLKTQEKDLPLVFATAEGEIGGGYHVTELKQNTITSIDCGGNIDEWRETHVQLLDGQIGSHMSISKFSGIATKSMAQVKHLGDAPLYFEFGLKNNGLRRYQIASVTPEAQKVSVMLSEGAAQCKPAAAIKLSPVSSACCGTTKSQSNCCT